MNAGHRRAIVIVLIIILALSTASVAFADGPPAPNLDVCYGDLPGFGTEHASCQHQMSAEAPLGPLGPLGP
jgi:hypothetical protein